MTVFAKGQRVYMIGVGDKPREFTIKTVTVASCGKKNLTVFDHHAGEMMRRKFTPRIGADNGKVLYDYGFWPCAGPHQAFADAREYAEQWIEQEKAMLERQIERFIAQGIDPGISRERLSDLDGEITIKMA